MIINHHDTDRTPLLIAEIGNNHEGDASLALEMVSAAIESGVDIIKVQIINPEQLIHRSQSERIAQLSRFRLSFDMFGQLATLAHSKGALFMASVFDIQALEIMSPMLDVIKIASGDLDFEPLLIKAARCGKPVILSTGMSTLEEIRVSTETITAHLNAEPPARNHLALLHCVSLYPTPLTEANLGFIQTLSKNFDVTIGYSDHTLGIETAILSLAYGGRIIEKHFTLDKTRATFRDHALSADPNEMRRLAEIVHTFDQISGHGTKILSEAELNIARIARRSIVANRDLEAHAELTWNDLAYVRPRNGMPPTAARHIVGRKLRTALKTHDLILETHLE